MSVRKSSLDVVLRYAKRIQNASQRKIDFGTAVDNKTTSSHKTLLDIKKRLNDGINRLMRRETKSANDQFKQVIMKNVMAKTGKKKISFDRFKQMIQDSNLDQVAQKKAHDSVPKQPDQKDKSKQKNGSSDHKIPFGLGH